MQSGRRKRMAAMLIAANVLGGCTDAPEPGACRLGAVDIKDGEGDLGNGQRLLVSVNSGRDWFSGNFRVTDGGLSQFRAGVVGPATVNSRLSDDLHTELATFTFAEPSGDATGTVSFSTTTNDSSRPTQMCAVSVVMKAGLVPGGEVELNAPWVTVDAGTGWAGGF